MVQLTAQFFWLLLKLQCNSPWPLSDLTCQYSNQAHHLKNVPLLHDFRTLLSPMQNFVSLPLRMSGVGPEASQSLPGRHKPCTSDKYRVLYMLGCCLLVMPIDNSRLRTHHQLW
ncbi:hypothetical protein F4777DRAFT_205263 [Nemania sp. FL0916]|nr:hypothetical protein F4777DRAFT_205263 [Nemania sp. FL0916]